MPAIGATILGFVVWHANVAAQRLGFVWIGLGLLVLAGLYLTRRRPTLSGLEPADRPAPLPAQPPGHRSHPAHAIGIGGRSGRGPRGDARTMREGL